MPSEIGWVFERIGWVLELVGFLKELVGFFVGRLANKFHFKTRILTPSLKILVKSWVFWK